MQNMAAYNTICLFKLSLALLSPNYIILLPQPRATQNSPRVVLLSVKKTHHNHKPHHNRGHLLFSGFGTIHHHQSQIKHNTTTPGSFDFFLVLVQYITTKAK